MTVEELRKIGMRNHGGFVGLGFSCHRVEKVRHENHGGSVALV